MRTASVLLLAALLGGVSLVGAQSSQFGSRGLGLPGRGLSVDALGTEGATGLFSSGSSLNPAALGLLNSSLTSFSTIQEWRTSENPAGSGSTREQRFPMIAIAGPIPRSNFSVGVNYSTYANRDFLLVSEGTAAPRGEPIAVTDSVGSTGGLSDFQVALAYNLRDKVYLGVGVHLLTGSNRVFSNRAWADSTYLPTRQSAELTYLGTGVSAGVVVRLSPTLAIAGMARYDGALDVERDSAATGSIDLPATLAGGVRWQPSPRVAFAGHVAARTWSRADDGIVALGGVAARNTIEVAAGLEWYRNLRRPEQLPLRVGIRRSELPFLLVQGSQPRELGVSIGTGLRFARGIGGLDLALERIRRTQGDDYTESAWQFSLGVSLRGVLSN
ncbi:MAG: hypothetical protein AB7N73_01420 [Gemmatimonadales bacterium]